MRIGFIGLGRMGANMVRRLLQDGHEVVATTARPRRPRRSRPRVPRPSFSIAELVGQAREAARGLDHGPGRRRDRGPDRGAAASTSSRATRSSTAATPTSTTTSAATRTSQGQGVHYVDAGTSGGIWGLKVGYCLMVGGEADAVTPLEPIFRRLAPEGGYLHVGGPGAGHYVKMVHNGIEYGLMQAYAEGFEIMHASEYAARPRRHRRAVDARLRRPLVAAGARRARVPCQRPGPRHLKGYVADSGEGRWTVQEAIDATCRRRSSRSRC